MVDPWVLTPEERRQMVTSTGDPMDETREPAREPHAQPEVIPEGDLLNETWTPARETQPHSGIALRRYPSVSTLTDETSVGSQLHDRTPIEMGQMGKSMRVPRDETRGPVKETQAHHEVPTGTTTIATTSTGNVSS